MTWAQALRRPRVYGERIDGQFAEEGDACILRELAASYPAYRSMASLGGYSASQAVYRLRNTYGADIIETITGLGYRLSARGLRIAWGAVA